MGSGDLERLGARVRALRRSGGFTQQQLANASGVTRSSIANIEAGRQGTPTTKLGDLARALGVTVGDLMDETAPAVPWLNLARRNQSTLVTYETMAEKCWRSNDYLTAIRYRGIAEGLEMAQRNQIEAARTADTVEAQEGSERLCRVCANPLGQGRHDHV